MTQSNHNHNQSFPSIDIIDPSIDHTYSNNNSKQQFNNNHHRYNTVTHHDTIYNKNYDNALVTKQYHTLPKSYNHTNNNNAIQTYNNNDYALQSQSQSQQHVNSNDLTSLARSLRDMLQQHTHRQDHINTMNQQLMAYNFMLHFAQHTRTNKLENDYAIIKQNINDGQVMLTQLNSDLLQQQYQLEQLESQVSNIETDVSKQQEQYNVLNDELYTQKNKLEQAMTDYDIRIQQHENMLKQQEYNLQRLLNVRLKLDFGIDCLILLFALYCSRLGILTVLIKFITNITMNNSSNDIFTRYQQKRKMYAIIQIVRIVVFSLLVHKMRSLAIKNGLHNKLGNTNSYTQIITSGLGYVASSTARLIGGEQAENTIQSITQWFNNNNSNNQSTTNNLLQQRLSITNKQNNITSPSKQQTQV